MALVEMTRADGVAVLTLNDPDRRNAMTVTMGEAVEAAFHELATDDDVRAIVLTGAAPAFSAGGDLDMLADYGRRAKEEAFDATGPMRAFYRRFLAVRESPVPVIAAINGHAVGAGLCVALACDLRIVADEARVGLNFTRIGLHPGMGGSWLLPRIVGQQRAAQMLFTGELVTGSTAARWGLAIDALPAVDVLPRAMELAATIAANSPLAVRQVKATLNDDRPRSLAEQLDHEAAMQADNYRSPDIDEGIAAVRQKRAPRF